MQQEQLWYTCRMQHDTKRAVMVLMSHDITRAVMVKMSHDTTSKFYAAVKYRVKLTIGTSGTCLVQ